MKRKIVKLLCNLIPVSKWRRKLRKKLSTEKNIYYGKKYSISPIIFPPVLKIDKIKYDKEFNVVIVNDSRRSPSHLHLGCFTVMNNIDTLCYKYSLNIVDSLKDKDDDFNREEYKNTIKNADAIIINGEGTLHDNVGLFIYKRAEIAKEMGKKVFLINSVWQNNPETKKYLNLFDLISVRESNSLQEIKNDGYTDAILTPDLSFYARRNYGLNNIDLNLSEKKDVVFIDSVVHKICTIFEKKAKEKNKDMLYMRANMKKGIKKDTSYIFSFNQLAQYKKIISGRFHTLCMAMMMGIPTLSADSNTHKINGLLNDADIDIEKYIYHKEEDIDNFLKQNNYDDFIKKANNYSNKAVEDIEGLFLQIREIIENE